MTFPNNLKQHFEQVLADELKRDLRITRVAPLRGKSSLHQTFRLETTVGFVFAKLNYVQYLPHYQAEATGLQALERYLRIPKPLAVGKFLTYSYLLLTWIEERPWTRGAWVECGQELAYMHRHAGSEHFGWESDNYLGTQLQLNTRSGNWHHFFVDYRLRPSVEACRQKSLLPEEDVRRFSRLYNRLPDLLVSEAPCLLHGDMWGANQLNTEQGIVFFDPAVHYGHREAEIALTLLFRQFPAEFYEGYQSQHPLQPGWEQRARIYNLYPLLVHLNLFGTDYLPEIKSTLRYYVG